MRKIIGSIVAAVALLLGTAAIAPSPADAHYLPPGQWYTATDACVHQVVYGNFGSMGFAQWKFVSNGCSIYSQFVVTTAHDGHTHAQACSLGSAIFSPQSYCFLTGATDFTTIQAQVHGTALRVETQACGPCVYRSHGVFE